MSTKLKNKQTNKQKKTKKKNKKKIRITFNIKAGCYLELSTPETMKLLEW